MPQKKIGFNDSQLKADKLIIHNGLTASATLEFVGATARSFRLPQAAGTAGQAIITDGVGNLSFATITGATGPGATQTLEQTLSVGNESGTYSIGLDFYYQYDPVINSSVSGFFTQSLVSSNSYFYTLTGNTTFSYTAATYSIYNFFIKAGTHSFTLNSASNWQTIAGTALGFTGSFVISAGYDGSDLWIAATKNFLAL